MRNHAARRLVPLALFAVLLGACGSDGIPAEDAAIITELVKTGLADSDPFVRAETLSAIGVSRAPELYPMLVASLADDDPMVRSVALVEAARVDPVKAKTDIVPHFRDAKPKEQRFLARHLLAVLPHGDVEDAVIKLALQSDDALVRRYGFVYGIEPRFRDTSIGKREQLGQVSRLVDGEDNELAGRAMRLLAQNKNPQRVEAEVQKLTSAKEEHARMKSLHRLVFAGVKETEDALKIIAESSPPLTKAEAYLALVSTGDSEAVSHVRDMIGTGSADEKVRILGLLPRARGSQSLELMRPYRGDARIEVRTAVQAAMAAHPMASAEDFRRGVNETELEVSSAALLAIHRSQPDKLAEEFVRALKRKHADPVALTAALGSARYELWLCSEPESLAKLDATIASLRGKILPIALGPDVQGRVAAAELVFVGGDPLEIVQNIDTMNNQLRYAFVRAVAESVHPEDPLRDEELFRGEQQAFLFATKAMAGAGLWRGYVLAGGNTAAEGSEAPEAPAGAEAAEAPPAQ
jgi:hypothetical protein